MSPQRGSPASTPTPTKRQGLSSDLVRERRAGTPPRGGTARGRPRPPSSRRSSGQTGVTPAIYSFATVLPTLVLLVYALDVAVPIYSQHVGDWAAEAARSVMLAFTAYAATITMAILSRHQSAVDAGHAWLLAAVVVATLPLHATLAERALLRTSPWPIEELSDTYTAVYWSMALSVGICVFSTALGGAIGSTAHRQSWTLYQVLVGFLVVSMAPATLLTPVRALVVYPICLGPPVAALWACTLAAVQQFHSERGINWARQRSWLGVVILGGAAAAAAWTAVSLHTCGECSTPSTPLIAPNYAHVRQLWRCRMRGGGVVAVVEGAPAAPGASDLRYRLLRLDHSIMGGVWIHPPEFNGRPVYTAFLLQAGARLLLPLAETPRRSLHVGLGVGTAVTALQRRGFVADAVEIHPEIVKAAQKWFGLRAAGEVIVGDVLSVVPRLKSSAYDLVIMDVFSGGSGPAALRSEAFFRDLKRTLREGGAAGALAVNFVGFRGQELDLLACRLNSVFKAVRGFADGADSGSQSIRNYVLIGTDSSAGLTDLKGAIEREIEAIEEAGPEDDAEIEVLQGMAAAEIDLSGVRDPGQCAAAETAEARAWLHPLRGLPAAASHWRTMRQQFGNEFWLA